MADTFTLDDILAEVRRLTEPSVAVVLPYGTPGDIIARFRSALGPLVDVHESPLRSEPPVGSCFVLDLTPTFRHDPAALVRFGEAAAV